MRKIIKNGTIVTHSNTYKADIVIENGIIVDIGANIYPAQDDKVLDADGQYVFPGGVDVHTHFDFWGTSDDFESGSKAAAVGGITTVVNFVEPEKDMNLLENFRDWRDRRTNKSCIDFALQPIINEDYYESVLKDLPTLIDEGIPAIKVFLAYRSAGLIVDDVKFYNILKKASEYGIITNVHCENGDVIDQIVADSVAEGNTLSINHGFTRLPVLEAEATFRTIAIAQAADAPIRIVHVTCNEAKEVIEFAQQRGANVLGETCPHYLTRDISYLGLPDFEGAKYVCAPPFRDKGHQTSLWEGLNSGVLTTIGSDHSPVNFEGEYSKQLGRDVWSKIPNGIPGVEEMFSMIYHYGVHEKRISLQKFVEVLCANPAKEFGLYPQKGCINVGSDADIVILDPNKSRTITQKNQYSKTDFNVYEGETVQGVITSVLSRGEEIVKDGLFTGKVGHGEYLKANHVILGEELAKK
ncbi:dihydropyrimidinase [Metabacillus fastidiosus]|uniref:dihydropyrimidinase n=1 Tax=Metabacillus fastidiosus TaxID=1458 RepID=UPI003D27988D